MRNNKLDDWSELVTIGDTYVDVMLSLRTQKLFDFVFFYFQLITYFFYTATRFVVVLCYVFCFLILFSHRLFTVSNAVRILWIVFRILHCLLLFLYSPKDVWHFVMYMKIHSNISKGLSVLLFCDQQLDVFTDVWFIILKKVCVALNPQNDKGLIYEREHKIKYF